ncbi:MAG: right-handed parallel beta-helix repeat-containing protein, partial [Thermoleophilia bacterium]|nr:right-handed parallel beta-helix repeat-containing protein [Thermoleophilia bacterium]
DGVRYTMKQRGSARYSGARRAILLTTTLAVVLLLLFAASALAFPDVPASHPYAAAVNDLSSRGIIGGYQNGQFGVNDPVKRAQFAKMIVGALEIAPGSPATTRFTDLGAPDANGYPHKYVQAAYDNGITTGTNAAQTLFAPWNSIRRDQVVSMIVRGANSIYPGLLASPPSGKTSLFDAVGEPHGYNLRTADNNHLLDGLTGIGVGWNPTATATRGEVAQMLWALLELIDGGTQPPPTTPPTTAPPSPPRDVWVYANGSGDYPTIEAAVAAISPGSTIHLGPGTFTLSGTIRVDSYLRMVGNGMSQADASVVTYAGVVVDVQDASFYAEKIRFVSTATTQASNTLHAEDADLELQTCYFSGGNRLGDVHGSGIGLYGSTTALIKNCVSTKNDLHGVDVEDEAEVTLEVNTILTNSGAGILLTHEATGVIRNNYCSYNGTRGIAVQKQASAVIEGNTCEKNTGSGITLLGDAGGTIRDNKCSQNGLHGIGLDGQADAVVELNTCVSNTHAGIGFFDKSRGTARRNECSGNKYGIYVDSTAGPTVESNNNLHGNTTNPQLYDKRLP